MNFSVEKLKVRGTFMKAGLMLCLLFLSLSASAAAFWFPPLLTIKDDKPVTNEDRLINFLGPIGEYSYDSKDNDHTLGAFRPLWSMENKGSYKAVDVIWPVAMWRDTWYFNFLWATLYYSGRDKGTGATSYHFIPIWFSGFDEGDDFYWGFFPIYGDVKNLIGYDRIKFILFPIFWETQTNLMEGQGYLWPIVNWDKGPNIDKFRVFPFYARNHRKGLYYAESYLWPIGHYVRSDNPKVEGLGWMIWPFCGKKTWGDITSYSFIWPLFEKSTKGDDEGLAFNCPWPLVQYKYNMEGKGKYFLWLCPFYGYSKTEEKTWYSVIWPLGYYQEDRGEDRRLEWYGFLPLYWGSKSWKVEEGQEDKEIEVYHRFWPLASYTRNKKGTVVKVLDIWPQRNMRVIERNWDPLWQLFTYNENKQGYCYRALWGIVSGRETEDRGNAFSFFPFYSIEYDLKRPVKEQPVQEKAKKEQEVILAAGIGGEPVQEEEKKESEKKNDEAYPVKIQDFIFGIFRITSYNDDKNTLRFIWFLEF